MFIYRDKEIAELDIKFQVIDKVNNKYLCILNDYYDYFTEYEVDYYKSLINNLNNNRR